MSHVKDESGPREGGQTGDPARTLVMKFGGTSVGTPEAMRQAVEIVCRARQEWPRVVVVTSALSGVTSLLLEHALRAATGDTRSLGLAGERLRNAHYSIAEALIAGPGRREEVVGAVEALVSDFLNLCGAIAVLGEATPRALDAVAGLGERMSVRLLAAALEEAGVRARYLEATRLIVTDSHFQDAHPDRQATARQTRQELLPLLEAGLVPVVTGFIAANPDGIPTTLGRGGSDYSAALIGAALPASEVWIWTDVDGVMTADPRMVPEARTIPALTYREIAELAYFGAKVLHPKTIRPVVDAGIGLRICNTFNPSHPGTLLVQNGAAPAAGGRNTVSQPGMGGAIKAVTAIHGLRLITLEGRGMLGVPGVAARTFGAVASTGTSVPLITQASSEQSICFAVPSGAASSVIAALEKAFSRELADRDIDSVWASEEVVIVTAVGAGMRHTPGVAGRIFSALGQRGVNVIAIAQGSSEVAISLVVEAKDGPQAVRALHALVVAQ